MDGARRLRRALKLSGRGPLVALLHGRQDTPPRALCAAIADVGRFKRIHMDAGQQPYAHRGPRLRLVSGFHYLEPGRRQAAWEALNLDRDLIGARGLQVVIWCHSDAVGPFLDACPDLTSWLRGPWELPPEVPAAMGLTAFPEHSRHPPKAGSGTAWLRQIFTREGATLPLRLALLGRDIARPARHALAAAHALAEERRVTWLELDKLEPAWAQRRIAAAGGDELLVVVGDGPIPDPDAHLVRVVSSHTALDPRLGWLVSRGKHGRWVPAVPPPEEEIVLHFTEARMVAGSSGTRVEAALYVLHRAATRRLWPAPSFLSPPIPAEAALLPWGRALYASTLAGMEQPAADPWATLDRVVIEVDPDRASPEAVTALLALPWELLADDRGFLFQHGRRVRVVRRLTGAPTARRPLLPARFRLLVMRVGPHSALPTLDLDATVLERPSFAVLTAEITHAWERRRHYTAVHLVAEALPGAVLRFEPLDGPPVEIDATRLGALLHRLHVPLVLLSDPTGAATTAAAMALHLAGIPSVIASSLPFSAAASRPFHEELYRALARGERVGNAVLASRRRLASEHTDPACWFVPLLLQAAQGDLALAPPPSDAVPSFRGDLSR
ncbi:MAG: CHAT domain-containing protein [Pseudomonadota bacterium]